MKTQTLINDLTALLAHRSAEATARAARDSLAARLPHLTPTDTESGAHALAGIAATNAAAARAAAALAKIPAARRTLADDIRRAAEARTIGALRQLGGTYSGETAVRVLWDFFPRATVRAHTTTDRGQRYSRACKWSKTDAKHVATLTPDAAAGLHLAPAGLIHASAREGCPLLSYAPDTSAVWLTARNKQVGTAAGWVAHCSEHNVCFHSIKSAQHAAKGLAKKVEAQVAEEARAEEARRAHRFSPPGKAARRAELVARLCAGAVATIADAHALGYCSPGIAAFQARFGIADSAPLPDLVRTGEPAAVRLALDVARRVSRSVKVA
jgi:hypothetical protein